MIRIQDPDPNPDPLVRCMDPRIRIHPKVMDPQHCTGTEHTLGTSPTDIVLSAAMKVHQLRYLYNRQARLDRNVVTKSDQNILIHSGKKKNQKEKQILMLSAKTVLWQYGTVLPECYLVPVLIGTNQRRRIL
jgi:hypothetical protein